ncbi:MULTISPECIES: heavy-metal-associated domain-containing protein [Streptomyces aurantiacus group]|uniref:Heavy metal transport/detoxification protein n=1 Tax=Streptomyces flaveus TaxID=66370 RepID=A0A917R4L0_9ACTN|nr:MULTISPECIES: copper ion binding protein [Streptomyces]GGK88681.1 heavy metal transport/detoxification protein [Streptomyces flaveus]
MVQDIYEVKGMTCDHCVKAVSSEVGALDGVTGVEVDLKTGRVTVSSGERLAYDAVAEAVDEAGYDLIARREQ